MKISRILWIWLLLLTLTGCGQGNDPIPASNPPVSSEDPSQNPDEVVELTPLPTLTSDSSAEGEAMPTPSDPILMKLIGTAIEDLAERLSVPAEQIDLQEAAEVIWSDSSLGCPNPSSLYTQVLTPGYLIRLQNRDSIFEYHAGKTGAAFYCPNPTPPHDILQSE